MGDRSDNRRYFNAKALIRAEPVAGQSDSVMNTLLGSGR